MAWTFNQPIPLRIVKRYVHRVTRKLMERSLFRKTEDPTMKGMSVRHIVGLFRCYDAMTACYA